MKFTCERDGLMSAIQVVQRAMPARSTLAALEGIHIRAEGDRLHLTCSDLVLCIQSQVPALVENEGMAVMPGRLFAELVRKLPQGSIHVQMDNLSVKIACGKSLTTLQSMDPAEYPEMPSVEEAKPLNIKQGSLKEMIRQTLFAVAMDETRPILTGELIEVEGEELRLVALDGYRLSLRKESVSSEGGDMQFVVPSKSMAEIAKLFEDSDQPATIALGENLAVVSLGDTKVITRLLQGEYIKYRQILPSEWQSRARVNAGQLTEAVERASLLAREGKNKLIKLQVENEAIIVTAESERGQVYEDLPVHLTGKELEIAFNSRYLLDVLRVISDEEIYLDFISNLSPCVIRPVEGEGYLYLILPVRLYGN